MRYTFAQHKTYDILPTGGVRVYYDEQEGAETTSYLDPATDEEISETRTVYTYKAVDAASLSRNDIIVALIRAEYTEDDELALQRQKDTKIMDYNAYSAYVELCKAIADKTILGDTLDTHKEMKVAELMQYDASAEVNTFYVSNHPMWLPPATRDNYMSTLQGAKRMEVPSVSFLGQTIPVDTAISMIDAVNLYAMQCVGVTDSHRAAINALQSIADVDRYDFTVGYPTKISF